MTDEDSIRKAKDNIKALLDFSKAVQEAAPYLRYMDQQLDNYSKACYEFPNLKASIYDAVDGPIGYVGSFTPDTFSLAGATGSTAMGGSKNLLTTSATEILTI